MIAHRFYGSDDGQIMVIDEWPDAESFNAFFAASESLIGPMMRSRGSGQAGAHLLAEARDGRRRRLGVS